jgi:hypothetical protein
MDTTQRRFVLTIAGTPQQLMELGLSTPKRQKNKATVTHSIALNLNETHYTKLREFHGLATPTAATTTTQEFEGRLVCLLLRYKAIGGSGFQAAIPGKCFEVCGD